MARWESLRSKGAGKRPYEGLVSGVRERRAGPCCGAGWRVTEARRRNSRLATQRANGKRGNRSRHAQGGKLSEGRKEQSRADQFPSPLTPRPSPFLVAIPPFPGTPFFPRSSPGGDPFTPSPPAVHSLPAIHRLAALPIPPALRTLTRLTGPLTLILSLPLTPLPKAPEMLQLDSRHFLSSLCAGFVKTYYRSDTAAPDASVPQAATLA